MGKTSKSVLLLGESEVGKSHYGAQLLKRLMQEEGEVRMEGAATNLTPFQEVIGRLDAGLSAGHTPTSVYDESLWPVLCASQGQRVDLIWPDYGGEQVKNIIDDRRFPRPWLDRVVKSSAWLLLIRLQHTRVDDDVFSRPLSALGEPTPKKTRSGTSDQARLVELLQILTYTRLTSAPRGSSLPRLVVLLTCWDEMEAPGKPSCELRNRLPLVADFIDCHWIDVAVLGLSALGQELDKERPNKDYIEKGSESFGYVILEDGSHSGDLTIPIQVLISDTT